MASELELLRQRITELEAKNTQLRQIIEENAKRDAENAEHKVRIKELEEIVRIFQPIKAELAKLRHDFDTTNLTRSQQPQHVISIQNSCSVGEEDISNVTTVLQPDTEPERCFASDPVKDRPINGATSDNINIKSMEERETDTFLSEVYKKSVSNEIRQKNREKKLLRESAIQDSSYEMKDKKSQSHKRSGEYCTGCV
ncbi:hypothetical protein C1646_714613 [Rhizophagus diaphanus]|nr:hypothetical protein C1646_714613 [Rhizophagus diaphanus] [Rhizophagus sp. MUCL 43196]